MISFALPGLEVPHKLWSTAVSRLCRSLRDTSAPGVPHRAAACTRVAMMCVRRLKPPCAPLTLASRCFPLDVLFFRSGPVPLVRLVRIPDPSE